MPGNILYQKNCNTGESKALYPITTLDKVIDTSTKESLDKILEKYNHIWLPFKGNSKTLTRQQVPSNLRRRGLWITYKSCAGKTVTEWYNSDEFTDKAWGDNTNWVQIVDKDTITKISKELLEWFKYPESGEMSGNIKDFLHWYESTMSFMWHKNHNLIPFDSIAFIGQTGQIYVQGQLIGVSTEEFTKLKRAVEEIQKIFSTEEGSSALGNLTNIVNFFEGFTTDKKLKDIFNEWQITLDGKVDKVKGKGLSTNDFTDELKNKLEEINSLTEKELEEILV